MINDFIWHYSSLQEEVNIKKSFSPILPTPSLSPQDSLSVSNIGVNIMGVNFDCSGPSKITYYPSVSGLTNCMAEYSISLITKNLTYRRWRGTRRMCLWKGGDVHRPGGWERRIEWKAMTQDPTGNIKNESKYFLLMLQETSWAKWRLRGCGVNSEVQTLGRRAS